MRPARDWDASRYHELSNPHVRWGAVVLDRLPLRGDETVVDAGCGTGRVTAALLQRLPRGRVVAVDRSPAMLAQARQTLAAWADRVTFVETDLLALDRALPEPADAIFSTAVFHWIDDHAALYRALAGALRPGGRIVAQCGGQGNLEALDRHLGAVAARPPFAPALADLRESHHRATPLEAEADLRAAGLEPLGIWLEPSPVTFPDRDAFAAYIQTVVLGRFFERLPPPLHEPFVQAIAEEVAASEPGFALDYVRLNIQARRSARG